MLPPSQSCAPSGTWTAPSVRWSEAEMFSKKNIKWFIRFLSYTLNKEDISQKKDLPKSFDLINFEQNSGEL